MSAVAMCNAEIPGGGRDRIRRLAYQHPTQVVACMEGVPVSSSNPLLKGAHKHQLRELYPLRRADRSEDRRKVVHSYK